MDYKLNSIVSGLFVVTIGSLGCEAVPRSTWGLNEDSVAFMP